MADFDLSNIQGLLGQFQPSEEDKRRALTQALASAGFGILGARNVNGWQALGQGGLIGTQSYNNALADASASKKAGLQDAMGALQVQNEFQKLQDAQKLRDVQTELAAKFAPGAQSPQQPPAMGGGTAASLMNFAVGGAPVAPPSAQPAVPDKRAVAQRYQAMGDYLMSKGFQPQAQQYYDLAQKSLPQIKEQRVVTQNGKRVLENLYVDGSREVLSDVGPDMEKAVQLDVGNKIAAVDPFTLQPIAGGGLYNKAMTPGETASNQVALANLGLARQREAREAANANPNKPTFDANAGQFVFPPSADNPTGRAVTPEGFTKPEKPLTEQQGNAMLFGNRMAEANKVLSDLSGQMDTTALSTKLADHPTTNMFASTDAQKLSQAKRNFMTAALRKESGASISQSEYDMFDKTYFPQFGDKPETLRQKAALRANAIANMQRLASGKNAPQSQGWSVMRVD